MCGEHTFAELDAIRVEGSSPHVRGAPLGKAYGCASIGIIPACAGSTRQQGNHGAPVRDHPRMCGEHSPLVKMVVELVGSSPHVRGAR